MTVHFDAGVHFLPIITTEDTSTASVAMEERPSALAAAAPPSGQSAEDVEGGFFSGCSMLPSGADMEAKSAPLATAETSEATSTPAERTMEQGDEYLYVSSKCNATKCFRLQWEYEINPRCREKTPLVQDGQVYLFDGFYVLCHGDTPPIPQFEYTRGGVRCQVDFIEEELPEQLCLTSTSAVDPTGREPSQALFLLQRYLFRRLLGIVPFHLFHETQEECGDYHLIPRFVSVQTEQRRKKGELHAPNCIGFASGDVLSIGQILFHLENSAKFTAKHYIEQFDPKKLVDCIVSSQINGHLEAFRVDQVLTQETAQERQLSLPTGPSVERHKQVYVGLLHDGGEAHNYDGSKGMKKVRKWREKGMFLQLSPRVAARRQVLGLAEPHLTGLRTDVFELGSAMPMVLKHMRHCRLLMSFQGSLGLEFSDPSLLRQAFTHGSYVDVGMQNVNTVEGTLARVRVGHVFENTRDLKRSRDSMEHTQGTMTADTRRAASQHLVGYHQEFHSKFLCPYERLEFLGDAVLSFLIASSAFLLRPSATEEELHCIRVEMANNEYLGRMARAANFESLLLSAFDLTKLDDGTISKIVADCFEALLGAVYKDKGIDACRTLLLELMARFDPEARDKYYLRREQVTELARAYVDKDKGRLEASSSSSEISGQHQAFSRATGVDIQRPHLWVQCLTHYSFKDHQILESDYVSSDPNYERIEFLGDAVLQLLSSVFLVDAFPYHQEHLLTQVRSALVKNTRLAVVARDLGYESFLRLGKDVKQGNLYVEDVLADAFEATLGAVYLEHPNDLDKVDAILRKTLHPLLKDAIAKREWMTPKKVFAHHVAQWNLNRSNAIKCTLKTLKKTGKEPSESAHAVALHVNDFMVARGAGRTISAAQDAACDKALMLYGLKMK